MRFLKSMALIFVINVYVKAATVITPRFDQSKSDQVTTLKITTLSTMLADKGIGEWGYAALIEVDGHKILFDTGNKPKTVLQNALDLNIDLSDVEDVFLSHNHSDHTGGLLTLRNHLKQKNPKALSRIHVAEGIFSKRVNAENDMLILKDSLESDGVIFIIHKQQEALFPGVWVTGPIPRLHDERNWSGNSQIETPNGPIEDRIPEDQSMAINTAKGMVLISGCGHAGIINTLEYIKAHINEAKLYAAIGGFHLVTANDEHLKWTGEKLKAFGLKKIIGAHCTGINALYALRTQLNLDRSDAVVGAVGDYFDLASGIHPGFIAR